MTQPKSAYPARSDASRRRSPFLRFVAIAMVFLLTPVFVFGATVAATGTVSVRVAESGPDGTNLWIPVPALLLDVAVMAAPAVMPRDALDEARAEIAPYLPGLRAFAHEIETLPSATLVEVTSPREHVRVAKDGRNFVVHVETDSETVRVSVPARLVGRSLDLLD